MVIQIMVVRNQLRIGGNKDIIVYSDSSGPHHEAVVHYHDMLSDADFGSADSDKSRHNARSLPYSVRVEQRVYSFIIFRSIGHRVVQLEA